MSDKPQEDILDQIIAQGLSKMEFPQEPPQEKPAEAAPEEAPATSGQDVKTASAAQKRNKRSAVYIYLLILFGAAFMMLLLAYFVQQRSNANTIDELRSSMNLSRAELLEQIKTLEEENETLQRESSHNKYEANQIRVQYEHDTQEAEERYKEMTETASRYLSKNITANMLALLERFCAEQDWLMASFIVMSSDYLFNEKNVNYLSELDYCPSVVEATRYLKLREEVFEQSGCIVLVQSPEDIYIDTNAGIYDDEELETARKLLSILASYSYIDSDAAAYFTASFYTGNYLECLESGAFQPSTVELFHQVKADLIEQGVLEENEDGTVSYDGGSDEYDPQTEEIPVSEMRPGA